MIAGHIADKWLVTIIYERPSKLNNKKTKNSIKLSKRTETSYRKIYGSKLYENILSQMQFITGMQFTIMLRYYDSPLRMFEIKHTDHIT